MSDNEQPLLIIYTSGLVISPGAKTYGELLDRFKIAAGIAVDIEQMMRATPLPQPPEQPDA